MTSPLVFAGPKLLADIQSGPHRALAGDLHVTGAQCTRWEGIVSTRTIDYRGPIAAEITPQLHYLVYGSWGGEHAMLLRSVGNPAVVTTMQAVRDLGAREITMVVCLLFSFAAVVSIGAALIGKRGDETSIARSDEPLPTPRPKMQPAFHEPAAAARSFARCGA